jgi:TRAP-type C4-dicarboxylate transport system permease small subunit
MSQCRRVIRSLDEIIASLLLGAIMLLTLTGVFFRYILHQPLAWQEEVSGVLMAWLVFMGCSVVAKKSAHIRIDSLTAKLPPRHRRVWLCMIQILVLAVLGIVLFYACRLTLQTQKQTSILKISYQYIYGAVPVSTLLMMGTTLADLVKGPRPDGSIR